MNTIRPISERYAWSLDRAVYGSSVGVGQPNGWRGGSVETVPRPTIVDELTLSPQAEEMLRRVSGEIDKRLEVDAAAGESTESAESAEKSGESELTEEEAAQVEKLADRDREVRTHEQAHLAAAGPYARGGPTYSYQKGPDGRNYAIGGEVQIDTAPVSGDPEATIQKARVVKAAALAPAEPSSQDQAVAAAATQMEMQARAEQAQKRQEQNASGKSGSAAEEDPRKGSINFLA